MGSLFQPSIADLAQAQYGNPQNAYMQGVPPPEPNALAQLQGAGVNVGPIQAVSSPDYVKPTLGNAGGGKAPADYDPERDGPILGVGAPKQQAPAAAAPPGAPPAAPPKQAAAPQAAKGAPRPAVGPAAPAGPSMGKKLAAEDKALLDERLGINEDKMRTGQAIQGAYMEGAEDHQNALRTMDAENKKLETEEEAAFQKLQADQEARHQEVLKTAAQARAMHVDPQHWFKEKGTAGSILAALAMGAGAFAANMPHSGGKNVAQDILNQAIDRDARAQEKDIEQAWKDVDFQGHEADKAFAADQFKLHNMRMARIGKRDHAMNMIEQQKGLTEDKVKILNLNNMQADLQKANNDENQKDLEARKAAWARDQQAARQAAAAAEAERKNRLKFARDYAAKNMESGKFEMSDEAKAAGMSREEALFRQGLALHDGDSSNAGFGRIVNPEQAGKTGKDDETVRATNEFNSQIDDLRKSPIITDTGLGTSLLSKLPQRLAPDSNRQQTELDAINTRMLQAVGKVAKDADGKPNKEMIERIEHTYGINLGDSPEQKAAKLTAVQDIYNSLARQQGASNAPLSTKK